MPDLVDRDLSPPKATDPGQLGRQPLSPDVERDVGQVALDPLLEGERELGGRGVARDGEHARRALRGAPARSRLDADRQPVRGHRCSRRDTPEQDPRSHRFPGREQAGACRPPHVAVPSPSVATHPPVAHLPRSA